MLNLLDASEVLVQLDTKVAEDRHWPDLHPSHPDWSISFINWFSNPLEVLPEVY